MANDKLDAPESICQLIKKELVQLHMDVDQERAYLGDQAAMMTRREQSKYLLFLFQRDLLPGLQGQILDSKAHRGNTQRLQPPISYPTKVLAWITIAIIDTSMLAYIFLFAVSQTGPKQRAWAKSFAVWMVVDVVLVTSMVAVCMHVLLPMLIMKDVRQIQLKLVSSIKQFYKEIHAEKDRLVRGDPGETRQRQDFNAASYLFLSHRVASMLYDQATAASLAAPSTSASMVAKMILQFHTSGPNSLTNTLLMSVATTM